MKPVFIILILVLLVSGCSKDGGGPTQKTAEELVTEGWQAYAAKNYVKAADNFLEALKLKSSLADAYNGSGWAQAKLNHLSVADTAFVLGLAKDPASMQMKAGLAFVYSAEKKYALSVQRTNEVLASDSAWAFSRDLSIGASDLHLLLAENYYAEGDFVSSLEQVRLLNSFFNADVTKATGRAELSAEIERLRTLV